MMREDGTEYKPKSLSKNAERQRKYRQYHNSSLDKQRRCEYQKKWRLKKIETEIRHGKRPDPLTTEPMIFPDLVRKNIHLHPVNWSKFETIRDAIMRYNGIKPKQSELWLEFMLYWIKMHPEVMSYAKSR